MSARWAPVPGYEGRYEVSNYGVVRSLERMEQCGDAVRQRSARTLKQWVDRHGYSSVRLSKGGVVRSFRVSRLVLLAFVGPGDGLEAAHKNHHREDNRLSNLQWATRLENEQQKDAARRRPDVPWRVLTPTKLRKAQRLRAKGHTQKQIGELLGCHHSTVSLALRRAHVEAV